MRFLLKLKKTVVLLLIVAISYPSMGATSNVYHSPHLISSYDALSLPLLTLVTRWYESVPFLNLELREFKRTQRLLKHEHHTLLAEYDLWASIQSLKKISDDGISPLNPMRELLRMGIRMRMSELFDVLFDSTQQTLTELMGQWHSVFHGIERELGYHRETNVYPVHELPELLNRVLPKKKRGDTFVGIAGSGGSGKTTVASYFHGSKDRSPLIHVDDFQLAKHARNPPDTEDVRQKYNLSLYQQFMDAVHGRRVAASPVTDQHAKSGPQEFLFDSDGRLIFLNGDVWGPHTRIGNRAVAITFLPERAQFIFTEYLKSPTQGVVQVPHEHANLETDEVRFMSGETSVSICYMTEHSYELILRDQVYYVDVISEDEIHIEEKDGIVYELHRGQRAPVRSVISPILKKQKRIIFGEGNVLFAWTGWDVAFSIVVDSVILNLRALRRMLNRGQPDSLLDAEAERLWQRRFGEDSVIREFDRRMKIKNPERHFYLDGMTLAEHVFLATQNYSFVELFDLFEPHFFERIPGLIARLVSAEAGHAPNGGVASQIKWAQARLEFIEHGIAIKHILPKQNELFRQFMSSQLFPQANPKFMWLAFFLQTLPHDLEDPIRRYIDFLIQDWAKGAMYGVLFSLSDAVETRDWKEQGETFTSRSLAEDIVDLTMALFRIDQEKRGKHIPEFRDWQIEILIEVLRLTVLLPDVWGDVPGQEGKRPSKIFDIEAYMRYMETEGIEQIRLMFAAT